MATHLNSDLSNDQPGTKDTGQSQTMFHPSLALSKKNYVTKALQENPGLGIFVFVGHCFGQLERACQDIKAAHYTRYHRHDQKRRLVGKMSLNASENHLFLVSTNFSCMGREKTPRKIVHIHSPRNDKQNSFNNKDFNRVTKPDEKMVRSCQGAEGIRSAAGRRRRRGCWQRAEALDVHHLSQSPRQTGCRPAPAGGDGKASVVFAAANADQGFLS